jgi:hypothetical protein
MQAVISIGIDHNFERFSRRLKKVADPLDRLSW